MYVEIDDFLILRVFVRTLYILKEINAYSVFVKQIIREVITL